MTSSGELEVCPHSGVVSLHDFGGRQCIVHFVTGERCVLDDVSPQRWRLQFVENGAGYIAAAGASGWVGELL